MVAIKAKSGPTAHSLKTSWEILGRFLILKQLITVIIESLFPHLRLVLCYIFSYDFPKIRNLSKIFPGIFENVVPGLWGTFGDFYLLGVPMCHGKSWNFVSRRVGTVLTTAFLMLN